MEQEMKRSRMNPTYVVLAAAMLAVLVTPLALAGAAKGPEASSSASVRTQVKKLKTRIAALESQNGRSAPSGPAGGDLAGQYPNPSVRANAIGTDEVANDTLTGADLAAGAVGTSELADNSATFEDLAADSVGASELKGVTAVTGAGAAIGANASGIATVTCPAGQAVLGGGFAWSENEAGTSIIDSAPSENDPNQTWVVTGRTGGSSNTLFAWANCLAV
jgi:hypothetical protein